MTIMVMTVKLFDENKSVTCSLMIFFYVGFANTLDIQIDGMAISRQDVCVGEVLTFVCPLEGVGTFQWTIPQFLNASNGVVAVGGGGAFTTVTRGLFTITAEGTGSNTRSTLQIAAFSGLSEVVCANTINSAQSLNGSVTLLGKFIV